jgi:hypothetical protein
VGKPLVKRRVVAYRAGRTVLSCGHEAPASNLPELICLACSPKREKPANWLTEYVRPDAPLDRPSERDLDHWVGMP